LKLKKTLKTFSSGQIEKKTKKKTKKTKNTKNPLGLFFFKPWVFSNPAGGGG
jgi:hypothetical protein